MLTKVFFTSFPFLVVASVAAFCASVLPPGCSAADSFVTHSCAEDPADTVLVALAELWEIRWPRFIMTWIDQLERNGARWSVVFKVAASVTVAWCWYGAILDGVLHSEAYNTLTPQYRFRYLYFHYFIFLSGIILVAAPFTGWFFFFRLAIRSLVIIAWVCRLLADLTVLLNKKRLPRSAFGALVRTYLGVLNNDESAFGSEEDSTAVAGRPFTPRRAPKHVALDVLTVPSSSPLAAALALETRDPSTPSRSSMPSALTNPSEGPSTPKKRLAERQHASRAGRSSGTRTAAAQGLTRLEAIMRKRIRRHAPSEAAAESSEMGRQRQAAEGGQSSEAHDPLPSGASHVSHGTASDASSDGSQTASKAGGAEEGSEEQEA